MVLDNVVFNKVLDIKNVVGSDLKTFIFNNNILGTMGAVTIAFSTGTMIRSLVGDLILPSIYSIFNSGTEGFSGLSGENVSKFIKEFISWLIVILITFLFIDYVLKRFIWTPEQQKTDSSKKDEVTKADPSKADPTKATNKKDTPQTQSNSNMTVEQFFSSNYHPIL
jgi:large-conductance mechanosensitive channel